MRRQAMRRARLVLCTSLAAAAAGLPACQPGDDLVEDDGLGVIEQGLVGATLTTTDPAVVALLTASGNVFCTGTLISPRVVLTAAHCIDDGGANFSAYFGDDVEASGGRRIAADRVMKHPGWTGDLSGGNDIGLVLLASAADPELPIALNTVPLTTRDGGLYRAVGFGIYDRDTRALDGKKRTAMFRIESFPSTYVEVTDPTPDDAVNTVVCQGDSGGPGFITVGTDEVLAGVHSYSIEGCFNPSGDTRVDLFAAVFVQPWIDANDPSCGVDGLCARKGCSADPDCEPCGADGTCATDCALLGLPDPAARPDLPGRQPVHHRAVRGVGGRPAGEVLHRGVQRRQLPERHDLPAGPAPRQHLLLPAGDAAAGCARRHLRRSGRLRRERV